MTTLRHARYVDVFDDVIQVCGSANDQDDLVFEAPTPTDAATAEDAVAALGLDVADLPIHDCRVGAEGRSTR